MRTDSLDIRPHYFDDDKALETLEFARLNEAKTIAPKQLLDYLSTIKIDTVGGLIQAASDQSIDSLADKIALDGHARVDVVQAIGWALLDITAAERHLKRAPLRNFLGAAGGPILFGLILTALLLFVGSRHEFMVEVPIAGDAIRPYQVITENTLASESTLVFGGPRPSREALLGRLSLQSINKGDIVESSQLSRFVIAEPEEWTVWSVPVESEYLIEVGTTVSLWVRYSASSLTRARVSGCVVDSKPKSISVLIERRQVAGQPLPTRAGIAGVSPVAPSCLEQVTMQQPEAVAPAHAQ